MSQERDPLHSSTTLAFRSSLQSLTSKDKTKQKRNARFKPANFSPKSAKQQRSNPQKTYPISLKSAITSPTSREPSSYSISGHSYDLHPASAFLCKGKRHSLYICIRALIPWLNASQHSPISLKRERLGFLPRLLRRPQLPTIIYFDPPPPPQTYIRSISHPTHITGATPPYPHRP